MKATRLHDLLRRSLAVERIDEILGVDGIDAVFIGPYDLSGSYGLSGQTRHRKVVEAERVVVSACRRAGIAAGLHVVTPDADSVRAAPADGFVFLALGMDTVFIRDSASRALEYAHSAGFGKRQ